jgi:CheY-like chemotaxis protein
MKIAVSSHNATLREGLHLQIAASGGIAVDVEDEADVVLVDAGTSNRPDLASAPAQDIPCLVLLAPNARAALPQMRARGFSGYLVKPVRQSSLVTRLLQCLDGTSLPDLAGVLSAPQASAAAVRDMGADGPSLNILLAEDNPINMLLIRELLRRRGHRITEVTTGTDAVAAMAEGEFDLLLTDIHMPGMDGIEAARAIRASEAQTGMRRTPIVALTADVLEAGRQACLEAGMDGFLTKPVNPAELEEMFRLLFPARRASHIVAA